MKIDDVTEKVKAEINKIEGMEVYEGLTEDEKAGLLPKAFLLVYEPPNDGTVLSADIRKLQKGVRNISAGNFLSEIAHSMLSKAVKTQIDQLPTV